MPTTQITLPHHVLVEEAPVRACPLCRHCGDPLELSQPDINRPDRRVGYCSGCDALSVLLPGLAVELPLERLAAEARMRFAALRREAAG